MMVSFFGENCLNCFLFRRGPLLEAFVAREMFFQRLYFKVEDFLSGLVLCACSVSKGGDLFVQLISHLVSDDFHQTDALLGIVFLFLLL